MSLDSFTFFIRIKANRHPLNIASSANPNKETTTRNTASGWLDGSDTGRGKRGRVGAGLSSTLHQALIGNSHS